MNGTISVDSIEGKGTTFTVLVPLHRAVEPVRSVKKALSKEPKFFETNAPTPVPAFEIDHPLAKVLVVEDDCLAARMVRQILQKCRCASDLAKSGKEALQYIEKTKYDLILTDIGLPDLDGFRLTHLIRHLESNNSTTPIIALTGHISADKKQECLEAGMQDMLSKPTTRDEIANLLSKYVPKIDDDSDGPKNKLEEKFDLPIDLTLGASLAGGSVKDAEDMIAMLIESLNQEVPSLNKAFQIRDYEMMYSIVHKVYGGLCYCGAPRLRALMLDLKNALVSKTYAPMGSLMDRVDSELDSLKKTALELNIKSTND
jgi:CheY-like chemotaxis protein/HPt (histidine-containing phosphotransfer) domain-containing protein